MNYFDSRDKAFRFITSSTIRYGAGNLFHLTANNNNLDPNRKIQDTNLVAASLPTDTPRLETLSHQSSIDHIHKAKRSHETATRILMSQLRKEVQELKTHCSEWGQLNSENEKQIRQLSKENIKLRHQLMLLQQRLQERKSKKTKD